MLGGADNGTHRMQGNNWARVRGGDGMECAVSTKDANVMYSSSQYGNLAKSTNGGADFNANFNLTPNGNGNWLTPYVLDPRHPDTLYADAAVCGAPMMPGLIFLLFPVTI
ncbi:MAG: hypothetical protein U5L96_00740 [Owenweeksia sp.]|nr:hypothetical protein [Owenweeksia sp.]